mmetsp:Transcript_98232/g.306470  ORF Transcript_98232/g.306470 Transcript_98232/m.306470 type:complete len:242 (-) Transcript_98232:13-738(-)
MLADAQGCRKPRAAHTSNRDPGTLRQSLDLVVAELCRWPQAAIGGEHLSASQCRQRPDRDGPQALHNLNWCSRFLTTLLELCSGATSDVPVNCLPDVDAPVVRRGHLADRSVQELRTRAGKDHVVPTLRADAKGCRPAPGRPLQLLHMVCPEATTIHHQRRSHLSLRRCQVPATFGATLRTIHWAAQLNGGAVFEGMLGPGDRHQPRVHQHLAGHKHCAHSLLRKARFPGAQLGSADNLDV